jgi:hypothetical protein
MDLSKVLMNFWLIVPIRWHLPGWFLKGLNYRSQTPQNKRVFSQTKWNEENKFFFAFATCSAQHSTSSHSSSQSSGSAAAAAASSTTKQSSSNSASTSAGNRNSGSGSGSGGGGGDADGKSPPQIYPWMKRVHLGQSKCHSSFQFFLFSTSAFYFVDKKRFFVVLLSEMNFLCLNTFMSFVRVFFQCQNDE